PARSRPTCRGGAGASRGSSHARPTTGRPSCSGIHLASSLPSRSRRRGARMDGLSLLKEDHDKAKEAIRKIEGTNDRATKEREELFQALVDDLTVHERNEEEIFGAAAGEEPEKKDMIRERYVAARV